MNKVLVTGASGFVGTHLLEALSNLDIGIKAQYFSQKPENAGAADKSPIKWIKCNLITDDISTELDGVDVIFHLAGYSGLGSDPDTVKRLHELNVVATERLAMSALETGCRFVYVSTVHACEEASGAHVIDEENGSPKSEYGRSKLRAEDLLRALGNKGLNFTILRPTQLFGEYHEGSVYELVKAIKNRRFFLIGDGKNATNFYYVKDFVDILMQVAENPVCSGKTYIAADEPMPLARLVQEIGGNVGVTVPRFRLPAMAGMMAGAACDMLSAALKIRLPLSRRRVRAMTKDVQYSNQRLVSDLGGKARFGMATGLARTISWYRSAGLL